MCLYFHTSCKGREKWQNGIMERDVFGQLLFSTAQVELIIVCYDLAFF